MDDNRLRPVTVFWFIVSTVLLAVSPLHSAKADHAAKDCQPKTNPLPYEGHPIYADAIFGFTSDADEKFPNYYCFERLIVNNSSKTLRVNWYDDWGTIMRATVSPNEEISTGVKGGTPIEKFSTLEYGPWGDEEQLSTRVWRSDGEVPVPVAELPWETWVTVTAELGGKSWEIRTVVTSKVVGKTIVYDIKSDSPFPMVYAKTDAPDELVKNTMALDWKLVSKTDEYRSAAKGMKFTLTSDTGLTFTLPAASGVRVKSASLIFTYPGSDDWIEVATVAYVPAE